MSRPIKKKKKFINDDVSEEFDLPLMSSSNRSINKPIKVRYEDAEDVLIARKKAPKSKLARENIMEEDMRQCFDLLSTLMDMPQAPAFNDPLDYNFLGLWLYPTIIKIPMDLGSIKTMLLHNTLAHPDHFADHVRLVFKNAMEFNQEGSPVYVQAQQLLEVFEQQYAELINRLYPAVKGDPMDVEQNQTDGELTPEEQKEYEEKKAQVEFANERIGALKRSIDALKKEKKKPTLKRIRLNPPHAPLTYTEKEEICRRITEIPPDNLPGLLEIIQAAQPPSAGEDGEVEIDIEKLDDGTLLKVKAYVDHTFAMKNAKKTHSVSSKSKPKPSKLPSGQAKRSRPVPSPSGGAPKANPVSADIAKRDKLASAQAETKKRIADIQKQITGVDKAKSLVPSMTIAINPEDPAEGFWVGQVTAPPANGEVMVQWYEMRDRETTDLNADVRYYAKSPNYDRIPTETIMFGIDIKLLYDQERMQWVLTGVRDIMNQIRNLE